MKKSEPIEFIQDGIKYKYTFTLDEYDGNKIVKWEDCFWQPKNLREDKE